MDEGCFGVHFGRILNDRVVELLKDEEVREIIRRWPDWPSSR